MRPHIVQIVRRFGPVGGMETYVWKLVNGLVERGYSVSIICECVIGAIEPKINVVQVAKAPERPRWKSMYTFRDRVDAVLKEQFKNRKVIIHSHERSISHHITTFHGPPICQDGNLNWLSALSPRIRGWRELERHELLSDQVQCVIPVSSKILESLIANYPLLRSKRLQLGWPGVENIDHKNRSGSGFSKPRFIFVGKEWKRKGLLRAVDIVEIYRKTSSHASLDIYGVELSTVPKVLHNKAWIKFMGWSATIPWAQYDVLIHPAETEPFGMVVAEARAHGLAVLMSDRVGAADLSFNCVKIVALDAPLCEWVNQLISLESVADRVSQVKWTWNELVDLHCQTIYPQIRAELF